MLNVPAEVRPVSRTGATYGRLLRMQIAYVFAAPVVCKLASMSHLYQDAPHLGMAARSGRCCSCGYFMQCPSMVLKWLGIGVPPQDGIRIVP